MQLEPVVDAVKVSVGRASSVIIVYTEFIGMHPVHRLVQSIECLIPYDLISSRSPF